MKYFRNFKRCVLASDGVENNNADSNKFIFCAFIKDTKLYVPVVTLSAKDNQKLSKLFSKGFKRSVSSNGYKRKSENKNTTSDFRYFLESNLV